MSGIAGIIQFDGRPAERARIQKMTDAMAHRGPDGNNYWIKGSVALGQCMMRTTPESLEENQPLTNEDETFVLVMDGRVDNWEELRAKLLSNGARLRTRADAELVLAAYETWGRNCIAHFDGDFAFAIWDQRRRELFCARDRIGNKPLTYHWHGKTLVFASELHAILALPWVPQTLNEGMVAEFLSNEWYSRDETFWRGVMRVAPAHTLIATAHGPDQACYWEPDFDAEIPGANEDELVRNYHDILYEQVRRMCRSHATVACEVSGGLDSSAIFALAADMQRHGDFPAPGLAGFGLAFPDDPAANEISYIRSVAAHVGRRVEEVQPTIAPISWFADVANRYHEFPGFPNGAMALRLRESARTLGSRVILTGVGGDEWLGKPYRGAYYAEEIGLGNWKNVCDSIDADRKELGLGRTLWWLVRYGAVPLLPDRIKAVLRGPEKSYGNRQTWLSNNFATLIRERRERHEAYEAKKLPQLARHGQIRQFRDLYDPYSCHARETEERFSASLGLECRSPFNSSPIVQLAFATPERFRTRAGVAKQLHRQAMKGYLPEVVRQRRTKSGFNGVFQQHLAGIQAARFDEVLERREAWISKLPMAEIIADFFGQKDVGYTQWIVWCLLGCDLVGSSGPLAMDKNKKYEQKLF